MTQYDDLEEIRELYNRYAIAFDENHPDETEARDKETRKIRRVYVLEVTPHEY